MDLRPRPTARRLADAPGLGPTQALDHSVLVTGVTLDSRQVRPGDLYAALPGATTHGARFVPQATAAGAAAVLTDPAGHDLAAAAGIPVVVVPDPRGVLGEIAAWCYGHPGRNLTVLGVTGTNGKTTVTYLLAAALDQAGVTSGIIGTIGVRIAGEQIPSARTTPEAPDVHALLAVMRERGVGVVAMEVSSHALALGRVDGLRFDVAAFTNLSQDHLDFHGDMAEYFATKASLFTPARSGAAVVCTDDEWGRRLRAGLRIPTVTYGVDGPGADWTLSDVRTDAAGVWHGVAAGPAGQRVALSSRLPGRFNQANALGALTVLVESGVSPDTAAVGIASCEGVPGRMQPVGDAAFAAFVDYAHTPEAVARAVAAAREFASGRVLVALGCGGDRDPGKRPLMGRVAATAADLVVVTDDNPRSEDPAVIRQAVLRGARQAAHPGDVTEVADRRTAIRTLVAAARPGDVVLVLGKGHEQGQEAGGVVTPFDDRDELAAAIRQASGSGADA